MAFWLGMYSNPIHGGARAYEGLYVLAVAMKVGGITPIIPVKEARTKIHDHLTGLRDFPGLGDSIEINKDGEAIKKTIVFATQNGAWVRR